MNNTQHTTTMTISNNPIIVAQVNCYVSFLSCTNQDSDVRAMVEIIRNDDRTELVYFLQNQVLANQFTTIEFTSRRMMAKSLLNLIEMF